MNCPICLSVMYCRTEIHNINNGYSKRMDLHCYNASCLSTKANYIPHMGVIMVPNVSWECYSYNLPFLYNDKWYSLTGSQTDNFTKLYNISFDRGLLSTHVKFPVFTYVSIYNQFFNPSTITLNKEIIKIDFISLSTDNDMHFKAIELFNRLINLTTFS